MLAICAVVLESFANFALSSVLPLALSGAAAFAELTAAGADEGRAFEVFATLAGGGLDARLGAGAPAAGFLSVASFCGFAAVLVATNRV